MAVSVRVKDCASVVGAVQVEMGEAAAAVRTGGGKVPANVVAITANFAIDWL